MTEMLPADNTFVQIMKLLFCCNLVISYPLTIVPTFTAIETTFLGQKETGTIEEEYATESTSDGGDDEGRETRT